MPSPAKSRCPFCRSQLNFLEVDIVDQQATFQIRCSQCHARGPLTDTSKEAIKEWNEWTSIHPANKTT